jgi:hypothetical protein
MSFYWTTLEKLSALTISKINSRFLFEQWTASKNRGYTEYIGFCTRYERKKDFVKDTEIFADIVTHINKSTHSTLSDLSPAELAWRADPEGNSIGVTVWHYCRWLDVIPVRLLDGGTAEEEQWHKQGWVARTGYDPRGIGFYFPRCSGIRE